MGEPIDRPRNRRRRAELRLDDDDVLRGHDVPAELGQDCGQRFARIRAPAVLRQHVPRAAELVAGLLQPELADVARNRRLGRETPLSGQSREQVVLRSDPPS